MLSATALLAGATAFAQMQPGGAPGQQQQSMPAQQPQNQQQGMTPGMTAANAASPSDQAFVSSILQRDVAQVQLGQLAQQKSQSEDVKQFGQKMALNRSRLNEQLKPIAQKLDVSEPKGPSKKDKQLIAKLEALSGPQFDEEYIKAVVKDNEKDVKDFQSEAQSAQDPNLQQAAKQDATVLAEHQQVAEQLAQSHNVALDAKK
jgi:putative membrane protein